MVIDLFAFFSYKAFDSIYIGVFRILLNLGSISDDEDGCNDNHYSVASETISHA